MSTGLLLSCQHVLVNASPLKIGMFTHLHDSELCDFCTDGHTEALPNLIGMLARSEVMRQVTQVFPNSSLPLLSNAQSVFHITALTLRSQIPRGLPEFGQLLMQQGQRLIPAGCILPCNGRPVICVTDRQA